MRVTKLIFLMILLLGMFGSVFANADGVFALPQDLVKIAEGSFSGIKSMDKVVVPKGVLEIGSLAFANSSLKEIVIPDTVQSIADDAFDGCENLKIVAEENTYAYDWAVAFGLIEPEYTPSPVYDFEYVIEEGECTVTNYSYWGYSKNVVVPEEIEGCPVTAIGNNAFYYCRIENIVLPDTVVRIGKNAFKDNDSLLSIRLPCNVQTIGEGAFESCGKLQKVFLPGSLTEIPDKAFDSCINLEKVTLPRGIERIGTDAFRDCWSLKEIVVPETVSVISDYAFRDCTALERVVLKEGLKTIGTFAFGGCESLKDIVLPESLNALDQGVFASCNALEKIVIPNGITEIQFGMFQLCNGLKEVILPETLNAIGEYAFRSCTNLKAITIPSGVKTLKGAFTACASLETVVIPEGVVDITRAFVGCTSLRSVQLPDSLTEIGESAFSGCSSLSVLPDLSRIKVLCDYAFSSCNSLTAAFIPGNVKTIGKYVFAYCSSLEKVVMYEGVSSLGRYAFRDCTSLNRICIPSSIKKNLYATAFKNCSEILTIYCRPDSYAKTFAYANNIRCVIVDSFASVEKAHFNRWMGNNVHTISLPETSAQFTVTWQAKNAVEYDWRAILIDNPPRSDENDSTSASTVLAEGNGTENTLSVPKDKLIAGKFLKIEVRAHGPADSSELSWIAFKISDQTDYVWDSVDGSIMITGYKGKSSSAVVPSEILDQPVVAIGESAFAGTDVSDWFLPDSIRNIGDYAFENADLRSIRLPENNLLELGYCCFRKATLLISIDLPSGLAVLPDGCFSYSGLTQITLPKTLMILGSGAFEGCASLKTLNFAENVLEEIPEACFYGCNMLNTVILPDSVRTIGEKAFTRTDATASWPSIYIGDCDSSAPGGDMLAAICYWNVYAKENSKAAEQVKKIETLGLGLRYGGNGCFTLFPEGHAYVEKNNNFLPTVLPHNHEKTFVCKRCAYEYVCHSQQAEASCWRCAVKVAKKELTILPIDSFELLERYCYDGKIYYRFCMLYEVNGVAPSENPLESSLFMDEDLRPVTDASVLEVMLKTHLYVGTGAGLFEEYPEYPTLTERHNSITRILTNSTNNTSLAENILKDENCIKKIGGLAASALRMVWGDPAGGLKQLLSVGKDTVSVNSFVAMMQITILKEMQLACKNHIELYNNSLRTVRTSDGVVVCEEAEKSLQTYCNAIGVWRLATECNSGIIEEVADCDQKYEAALHNILLLIDGAIPGDSMAGKLIFFIGNNIDGILEGDELSLKVLADKLVEITKILGGKGNYALNILFSEYKAGSYLLDEALDLKAAFDEYEKVYDAFSNDLEDSELLKMHRKLCN